MGKEEEKIELLTCAKRKFIYHQIDQVCGKPGATDTSSLKKDVQRQTSISSSASLDETVVTALTSRRRFCLDDWRAIRPGANRLTLLPGVTRAHWTCSKRSRTVHIKKNSLMAAISCPPSTVRFRETNSPCEVGLAGNDLKVLPSTALRN